MAVDADASDNGQVVYSLKGEGSEAFQVDKKTGEITVSRVNRLLTVLVLVPQKSDAKEKLSIGIRLFEGPGCFAQRSSSC